MQLFFAPFNLEWSRKLFEFCGIAVEDELVMGEAVCSEERESQSQAARASYFLSTPSPMTTRSKSKNAKLKASTKQIYFKGQSHMC